MPSPSNTSNTSDPDHRQTAAGAGVNGNASNDVVTVNNLSRGPEQPHINYGPVITRPLGTSPPSEQNRDEK
jgi:hypothetical protein